MALPPRKPTPVKPSIFVGGNGVGKIAPPKPADVLKSAGLAKQMAPSGGTVAGVIVSKPDAAGKQTAVAPAGTVGGGFDGTYNSTVGAGGVSHNANNPLTNAIERQIPAYIQEAQNQPVRQMENVNIGQAAQADAMQQAEFRNRQLGLANALQDQANGIGPSVAGSQLQQSTEMNLQAALAQAASQRGANLGSAQYALGQARGNITQQAAMQLAQARIQEQMAARAQLGEVLGQARGADIGMAQFNAGQQNQYGLAQGQLNYGVGGTNLGAGVQQDELKNQRVTYWRSVGFNAQQAEVAAQRDISKFNREMDVRLKVNDQQAKAQRDAIDIARENAARASEMNILGGALSAAGTIGGSILGGPIGGAIGNKLGGAVGGAIQNAVSPVAQGDMGPMLIKYGK